MYDALEQARVEVVGAQHMTGVSANLRARLAEECEAEGYDRMTRKDQLPLPAALALLARERMSGEASPPAATRILESWRGTLGEDAEQALAEMATAQADQPKFTRAARKLLAALNLTDVLGTLGLSSYIYRLLILDLTVLDPNPPLTWLSSLVVCLIANVLLIRLRSRVYLICM